MTFDHTRTTDHPTGTVTFLFTDIEGSTGRWEEQTEQMATALARHDAILADAVAAHGGWLFKHTGDGVLSAFSSAPAAVRAAIDAQRILELPVRMGITTGEAELRGDDYFGPTLNRAARIMAAGHGGQVLVANSTAALLQGFDLLDLGERRLRDLSGAQRLFQVRAEGLRQQFPELRTVDAVPGNLKVQATSFVGREAEVAEIEAEVQSHRLVTLTGVGGVGKTRLALQVAAELVPLFPDGVWLVELASVDDPAALPDAVANVLGVLQQAGISIAESVANVLAGRDRLLVLDNCEHVLDAAADLVELILARSATVKVLATSREGLRVAAEHLWLVPSLDVRKGGDSAAVVLFVERARAVAPRFELGSDVEDVVEICRRLDGIPLAIELAAARMTSMSAAEVRDRLQNRFRLLAGNRRGLERHQTLRHAVQWSFDLLDDDERTLLNRCSVFAGGFDLAGAVAVGAAGELDEYAVLDLLDALVRKSLLTVERSGGRTRYGMLETIRQFGEDQLSGVGIGEAVRDQHATYFAREGEEILQLWNSPRQLQAHEWLDTELANLRVAFRRATDVGDLDVAATIAIVGSFIGRWAQRLEPVGWAEELIETASASAHRQLPALYFMASICCLAGRGDDAVRYGKAGLLLIDDPHYAAPPFGYAHYWLGSAHGFAGEFQAWVEFSEAEIERAGDLLILARPALVEALAFAGHGDQARAMAGDVVAAAEGAENPASLAFALMAQGIACRVTEPAVALAALRRGLVIAHDSKGRSYEAAIAMFLARQEVDNGDRRLAIDLFARAIETFHNTGESVSLRVALGQLAAYCGRTGRHRAAATLYGASIDAFTAAVVPELSVTAGRMRDALGQEAVADLVREGAAMDGATSVRYARAEIQQARTDLMSPG